MLNLGIVGTSPIAQEFIDAAISDGHYHLSAVYSRKIETAQDFLSKVSPRGKARPYDQWQDFLDSPLDVVYIASPNAVHFEQARAALASGHHVIVEKPATSRPEEWQMLLETARSHGVIIFEAARNIHEEAFEVIKRFLADHVVQGAFFSYAKYSSKMKDLLEGREPNAFSHRMSGGALMDLGVYCLNAAIYLFGKPEGCRYQAVRLPNTVDVNGMGSLIYKDFIVNMQAGKNIQSDLTAEIYCQDGTLLLSGIEEVGSAVFKSLDGKTIRMDFSPSEKRMSPEVADFARIILEKDQAAFEAWAQQTSTVQDSLLAMREDAGIEFEVDHDYR